MKAFRYRYIYLAMAVLGVAGGFLYWQFWGCTDSCPITSSWKLSALRGGLIGLCVAALFQPSARPKSPENETPA